ncbi:hypothetical protein LTR78_001057 [Recurvomyces mirabilis]|uniref:Uncharacterized protein n=1 Tax=Recurvomyces mirabilis TaxID=574656 RepID=A0AAE1C648_9PEZI|nr:hypothetical protein LTR78_001057 [Recurvomyces mirabilis]KAK5159029.1 hypothetical protein LTS14_003137 [Recurvomyces mirabilis]
MAAPRDVVCRQGYTSLKSIVVVIVPVCMQIDDHAANMSRFLSQCSALTTHALNPPPLHSAAFTTSATQRKGQDIWNKPIIEDPNKLQYAAFVKALHGINPGRKLVKHTVDQALLRAFAQYLGVEDWQKLEKSLRIASHVNSQRVVHPEARAWRVLMGESARYWGQGGRYLKTPR